MTRKTVALGTKLLRIGRSLNKMKALLLAPMGSVHRRFNKANINALQTLGYEVELCANFENGDGPEIHNQDFVEECESKGVRTRSIPFVRHSLTGSLKSLPQLKKLLLERGYDIIHTHTETGGLLLRLAQRQKGKSRYIYTPHGMSFWKGSNCKSQLVYKPLEHWICSGMDINLGMNMEEMECLKHWNRESAAYVHGVGLNLDKMQNPVRIREDVRHEFELNEGEKLIVSIGELDDNKNHITVIKALSQLTIRDFKYIICGVGPNKTMLQEIAEELELSNNIIFAGFRTDIPDILNAADIFVFPSYHEGMPVSALEAMACGLPIICSKIRGNVDIVKDGENGFLFEPTDSELLSNHIATLLEDSEKGRSMGRVNRERVKEFSLQNVTEELKEIYGRITLELH